MTANTPASEPTTTPEPKGAKAELIRLRAARALKEQELAEAEEEEKALLELKGLQALEEMEKKHGAKKVRLIDTDLGPVIVKAPHQALVKRFQDKDGLTTVDFEALATPNVVYPTQGEYEAMITEKPGIVTSVAKGVLLLAGFRLKELAAK